MAANAETSRPTVDELLEALESSGPLRDHPAVQALFEPPIPQLTLIPGGRDDA